MAISEACQVWIEQRIEEELGERQETGKSLRAIGKDIAKEIERIFEAKVNPETKYHRATKALSNESAQITNENNKGKKEKQENQEIKIQHGGVREKSWHDRRPPAPVHKKLPTVCLESP